MTVEAATTMQGIVFEEKGLAVLRDDLERPVPGPDQILLRTLRSGLTNGTERNILLGGNYCPGFPTRAGYQIVGEVVEAGPEVTGYAVGDRVYSGHHVGHVEYAAVPTSADALVVKLGDGIELADAALFGVASVAMHDCRRADVSLGQRVLVVGLGLVGQFTAQCCRAAGAIVTGSDPDPDRRRVGAEWGCDLVIDPTTADGADALAAAGPYDAIFDASGADILAQLIPVLTPRGRLVLIAGRDTVVYPFLPGQLNEITVLQASHFFKDDIEQVIRLVLRGAIRVAPLIRDIVKIADAERIYGLLRDDPGRLFGTVFDWR